MSNDHFAGRGTSSNPANRFESLRIEADPEDGDAPPGPAGPTLFYRDASRSVLAENASPDVGFRWSLNPYRGCEHGCSYCLAPETPILHADLAWRPIGEVRVGDAIVGFDEHPEPGKTRKLRRAIVRDVWWSKQPTLRLVTRHSDVVTTAEHRWLQARDFRWSSTRQLVPGKLLRHLPVVVPASIDDDYRVGYVAGLSLGDGTFRYVEPNGRPSRRDPASYWRIALIDHEPLARTVDYLARFGIESFIRPFDGGRSSRIPLQKVEIRSRARLRSLRDILFGERPSPSYRRGFLAGFFDAEGHNGNSLRISQVHLGVLERVRSYARALGFRFELEYRPGLLASSLRLAGHLVDRLQFFSVCQPAIARKRDRLFDREVNLDAEPIEAIEGGPVADVIDITTSTGTFYAAGLATHNCYARPSHEYLGFSAGLDFERRIMVKDDAPELLRAALRARRWQPEVVALSGNTDCYQPVERRLRLTRRCVEVFLEFRNPIAVITKSALVARDADLYAALAAHGAAHVMCSITTLDPELARRLEPRAASPERRLEAIAALSKAGVPVGVMVAPVIPGLNDAEIPAILAAAAAAGATSAGWALLRLAAPLDRLFSDWLAEHYPDRQTRVLNRIRETRAGHITDSQFGRRMRGTGPYAEQLAALFTITARKHGLDRPLAPLSTAAFRRPPAVGDQMRLL